MTVEEDKFIFDKNKQTILETIMQKYPLLLGQDKLSSPLEYWIEYWSQPVRFNLDRLEVIVSDLDDLYNAQCKKPDIPIPQRSRRPDISLLREDRNERYLAQRRRDLLLGKRVEDMDEEEEDIWNAGQKLRLLEKAESNREYESDKLLHIANVKSAIPKKIQPVLTNEQQWFIDLPETTRSDYAQWCARKNILRIRKHWPLYVKDMDKVSSDLEGTTTFSGTDAADQSDINEKRNKLAYLGWSETDIATLDDSQINKEYQDEISREAHDQPNFDDNNIQYSRVKIRPAQGRFRAEVLRNWEDACAITGQKLVVEACHIIAHADGGPASFENGIALAADLHRLMDKGHLKLVNGIIVMSNQAKCEPRYAELHGRKLRKPCKPVNFN
jgi:hypothetical protein